MLFVSLVRISRRGISLWLQLPHQDNQRMVALDLTGLRKSAGSVHNVISGPFVICNNVDEILPGLTVSVFHS